MCDIYSHACSTKERRKRTKLISATEQRKWIIGGSSCESGERLVLE